MMTKYPEKASPRILQPPNSSHPSQLAHRVAYTEPGPGITQPILFRDHHHHQKHFPQPLSHHHSLSNLGPFPLPKMHESILREMEKQQIREEIIRSEIVKMRLLKDGARNGGIPFVSSSSAGIGFEPPRMFLPLGTGGGGQMPLEGRFLPWHDNNEKRLGGSSRGFGPSPSLMIPEVKSDPEGTKEIGKTIFLGNTNDEKTKGIKRKASSPAAEVEDATKKDKKWFCEVCHISATSEQALKEHMKGKKHKSVEQRAGKHYRMGMFTKNAAT